MGAPPPLPCTHVRRRSTSTETPRKRLWRHGRRPLQNDRCDRRAAAAAPCPSLRPLRAAYTPPPAPPPLLANDNISNVTTSVRLRRRRRRRQPDCHRRRVRALVPYLLCTTEFPLEFSASITARLSAFDIQQKRFARSTRHRRRIIPTAAAVDTSANYTSRSTARRQ